MRLNAYLHFDGQCEEAFRFYQSVLGGTIDGLVPFAGTPGEEHVQPGWRSKIMHASLTVGDTVLMGSDSPPGHYQRPQGLSVSIQIEDPTEADRVFDALAQGGAITFAIRETFWALRFGMVVDRFGTPWMVTCSRPD